MVSRIDEPRLGRHRAKRSGRRYRHIAKSVVLEILGGLLIGGIFTLKLVNYIDPNALLPAEVSSAISTSTSNVVSAVRNLPFLNSCPRGQKMDDVSGGFVCVTGPQRGVYDQIYDSYGLVGNGREAIYSDVNEGSLAEANDLLRNKYDIPRYAPVQLRSLPSWAENPYNAVYWRLEFYSLRPSLNLLYAFRTTGALKYVRQLRRIDLSFIAAESRSRWAWSDPHAVAFRSMALVDTWWKLRQAHQLSESASTAILRELSKTGRFLANPNHYQQEDNHGTNEAAALYELAAAFPSLPGAHYWLALASERFNWQLQGLIDADGQLIENSPYYDFYTLEKYWQVYNYPDVRATPIGKEFRAKIAKMLSFATYILQPNSQVPLLGASIEATINDFGVYRGLAATDPQFLYVLTHGKDGSPPARKSVFFRSSDLSVFRSGWGDGAAYLKSTYLTFNIGRYRTQHSTLDALAVTLYGDGGDLIPDTGLYTYTPGVYRNYFHGTQSKNTVVVDGRSQAAGDAAAGRLVQQDGVTYQSGDSALYKGVVHRRLVMMIDPDHVLIVDRLTSKSLHSYSQMFHLFPGAKIATSGLTVVGTGGSPRRTVTIQQLEPGGVTEASVINRRGHDPDGLCSEKYGHLLPCYAISYTQRARDATFMTLLTVGSVSRSAWSYQVVDGGRGLRVHDGSRNLNLTFGATVAVKPRAWATDPRPPATKSTPVTAATVAGNWVADGSGSTAPGAAPRTVSMRASTDSDTSFTNNAVHLDLSRQNGRLRIKVEGLHRIGDFRLLLSNDHWANSVSMDMADAYTQDYDGQWVDLFVGPSGKWGKYGGWIAARPGFNWSDIDGIQLIMSTDSASASAVTATIGSLRLIPSQAEGKVVVIFDDGYQSILPAAKYLHSKGLPADIAVIGKYVDDPTPDFLNVFQLKALQNNWGWDMVNHTQDHVDAVTQYYDNHEMYSYAADILQQAQWLEAHGLNSAPNWLIYPHGAVNEAVEKVVSKYYMFARVVADNPDAWPYGDPHAVSDLEIQYPGDGESGDVGYTPPSEIVSAVRQARHYHMTLILTFHRIYSQQGDPPGYPLGLFKEIANGIVAAHVKVLTLSELDHSNGIPTDNQIHVIPGKASQITVEIGS